MKIPSVLIAVSLAWSVVQAQEKPRVLYLTETAAYRHAVLPVSEEVMRDLAAESGAFEVTVTGTSTDITADGLTQYRAVMFNTTGELPMSDAQKAALMAFIREGGAFIGVHSATDTFYEWPEYGDMIGAYFDGHPWHEDVAVKVEDTEHPTTRHLDSTFRISDEIYQMRAWSRSDVHVLLSLDTSSVDMSKDTIKRDDGDFALAWTREYGDGRVFYTALGHEPDVWRDERFRRHLVEGIRWAMGR